MERIANLVTKRPKTVIIVALLLLIPCLFGYFFTEVNYDILSYLPGNIDSVKGEEVLSDVYNVDSTTMVIVKNMQPRMVSRLKDKISDVENVERVLWSDDIIDTSVPFDILPDEIRDIFYSQSGEYTMMFVQFTPGVSSKSTIRAVEDIKDITDKQCMLSGLIPISVDTKALTNSELPIYIIAAIIAVIVILLLTTESFCIPFIIISVLGIAVVYNMGTNWIVGGISFITQCIAVILQLAVTIDYSIFLINRFNEEKKYTADKKTAMTNALKASVTSLTGSSATTFFGFLALCFMQLRLGFNIGIIMAKGVALGIICVLIILPAFILTFDEKISAKTHKVHIPDFSKLVDFVIKRKKGFVTVFIIMIIPVLLLSASVKKYYNMTATLPDDLDSVVALDTLKEEFNMTTSHFIVVNDKISAEKLIEMENRIRSLDGITSMLAYNQFVGSSIPDSIIPDDVIQLVKQGGYQVMLVNSEFEAATDPSNTQVDEMYSIIKEYDKNGYITGEGAMYSDMISITNVDFVVTSIISIIAIFTIISIAFKSKSIPLILIASIEFAILINQAISTLTGTTISFIAPTVISCVQLGATVDYAILLTSRYKEELRKTTDKLSAMRSAACECLKSVFQSASIFFFVTISVYFISTISIVKELCALLARGSLISAAIIIFVLIPLLLCSDKFIKKHSKDWRSATDTTQLQILSKNNPISE